MTDKLPAIKPIPGLGVPILMSKRHSAMGLKRYWIAVDELFDTGPNNCFSTEQSAIEAWNATADRIVKAAREGT